MIDFTEIIGHEDIIKHFKKSIELGQVSQTYIIMVRTEAERRLLPEPLPRLFSAKRVAQSLATIVNHVFRARRAISRMWYGLPMISLILYP